MTALARHVSTTDTEDGMVVLDERSGDYFVVNGTGAELIRGLGRGEPPEAAVARLCAEHPGHDDEIRHDAARFLAELRAARLTTP